MSDGKHESGLKRIVVDLPVEANTDRVEVGLRVGVLCKHGRCGTEEQRRGVVLLAEVDELVLELEAQVGRELMLDAAANRIAELD